MKSIIFLSFLIILSTNSFCQIIDIIRIYETKSSEDRILLNEKAIADINCDLELEINKEKLSLKVGSKIASNLELISELEKYDNLLLTQEQILESLNYKIEQFTLSERIQKLGEFSDLMDDFYDKIFADEEIEQKFNQYFAEFGQLSEYEKKKYHDYYIGYGFSQLTSEIAVKIHKIQSSIEQKKIRIQLSAHLNTKDELFKKVHIENFDDYSEGEFYEVKRWVTSFSNEDIEAFNKTNELAQNLNRIVDESFQDLENLLKNNIASYKCLDALYTSLKRTYKEKDKIFDTNIEIAASFILEVQNEVNHVLDAISKIENFNSENENVLELYNSIQDEFLLKAKLFPSKINAIVSGLPEDFKNSNQEIRKLIDEFSSCKAVLSDDIAKVNNVISITSKILKPIQNTAQQGMQLGNEIYNHSISDLPQIGYINLKTTGKRANGDKIVIRLSIRSQEDIDKQKDGIVIEKHTLTLQQLKVYSESNVSLILASPYNHDDKVKLENKLQFAPSGSLLFKFGSRECKTWNFLEPGLGFNLSTPDFDLDGVPEVGLGGVVTILKDVVSIGISYNTKTDNPYWFFGLSLPFSTLGMPINTIKTNANQ